MSINPQNPPNLDETNQQTEKKIKLPLTKHNRQQRYNIRVRIAFIYFCMCPT